MAPARAHRPRHGVPRSRSRRASVPKAPFRGAAGAQVVAAATPGAEAAGPAGAAAAASARDRSGGRGCKAVAFFIGGPSCAGDVREATRITLSVAVAAPGAGPGCIMHAVWIDTHCHLDAPEFDADRDAVRGACPRRWRGRMVLPAVAVAHFEASCVNWPTPTTRPMRWASTRCTSTAPRRRATSTGWPPRWPPARDDPRLVAVGEIGLDHFVPGPGP